MKKYRIGIDIGGTSLKYGIIDDNGIIICKSSYPVNHSLSQEEQIEELGYKILAFIEKNGIDYDEVSGVGIGCPGAINSTKGSCDYSGNLMWYNLPICDILSRIIKRPVKISNDANVAVLGEARYGAGKGYQNIVMLTFGTGVGGGLVLNGELYEGNEGKGAELGHAVLRLNGRQCSCGRKGCIEAYASVTGLLYDTKKLMRKNKHTILFELCEGDLRKLNAKMIFEAAIATDAVAVSALNYYFYYMKEVIMNFNNIFRPELFILGGGISSQKEYILSHLIPLLEKEDYGFKNCPKPIIDCAQLGNDAGIIGAASLIK